MFLYQTFEKIVIAWRDNSDLVNFSLNPNDPNAKEDQFVAGEPSGFQSNLLKGIRFLQHRVSRMREGEDRITRVYSIQFFN